MRLGSLPHYAFAAAALILIGGQAVAQGLPVAPPEEIVAGAKSCVAATSATGVDERALEANGWHRGTISGNGKPVDTVTIYGKGKLLLTLTNPSAKICFLTARIQDAATFGDIGFAMEKGLGTPGKAKPGETNAVYWFPPGHIVQLQLTGKPDAPSVRVAVGYNSLEKK